VNARGRDLGKSIAMIVVMAQRVSTVRSIHARLAIATAGGAGRRCRRNGLRRDRSSSPGCVSDMTEK
jgi:hypothetical protein